MNYQTRGFEQSGTWEEKNLAIFAFLHNLWAISIISISSQMLEASDVLQTTPIFIYLLCKNKKKTLKITP